MYKITATIERGSIDTRRTATAYVDGPATARQVGNMLAMLMGEDDLKFTPNGYLDPEHSPCVSFTNADRTGAVTIERF